MNHLVTTAKKVIQNNLHVRNEETITIITDDALEDIAAIFYEAGNALGNETIFTKMKTRSKSGEEPPTQISNVMKNCDIAICITEHSLTHTNARREASATGTRVVTMPGLTLDMLEKGAITANYEDVEKLTHTYCGLLDEGEEVTLTKEGHTLSFSIKGRKSIASTGVYKDKGASGNLPSGESFIAPIETSANGTMIIDGSIAGIGVLSEPIVLTIENGRLIDATGNEGEQLLNILGDGDGRTIAEFGIGTNKSARLTGNVLEDEKVYGTAHIAFGSNQSFGGITEAGVHIDCVIKQPEIHIDGNPVQIN